jgi:uncharacterized coiled-coil DUF342 family protein
VPLFRFFCRLKSAITLNCLFYITEVSEMTAKKERPRDFRRKIKRGEESRDLWKDKHHEVQYDLKKARAIIDALKKSRDEWHVSYIDASNTIVALKEDVKIIQNENKILQEETKSLRESEALKKKQ